MSDIWKALAMTLVIVGAFAALVLAIAVTEGLVAVILAVLLLAGSIFVACLDYIRTTRRPNDDDPRDIYYD